MNAMRLAVPLLVLQHRNLRPANAFSQLSCVLGAGTLSVLLALAGCGGGGGGAGGAPAVAFVYPSSLATAESTDTVGGFTSPYALHTDTTAPQLVSVPQTVLANVPATGRITFTVSAIQLPSEPSPEPAFVVTFDLSNSGSPLPSNPLDSPSLSPNCSGCLRTVTMPASDLAGNPLTQAVTFTYLDPASSPLNYSTLGMWTKPSAVSTIWSEVGGPFSAGVVTRGIDLPITGTASYDGFFIGRFATSDTTDPSLPPGTYIVGANAHVVVNFSGGGAVTVSTSNTQISRELGAGALDIPVAEPRLDLSTTTAMTITRTPTSNVFLGVPGTLTNGFGMNENGQLGIGGAFYGPPTATAAPELGGSLAVGNPSQSLVGSFALKTP